MRFCFRVLLVFFMAVSASRESYALVVAGANGGGNTGNNTTAAQMESQLGLSNAFFYSNVLQYSDANAVYLGWGTTTNGPRAFMLSAMHITFSSTVVIDSITYGVTRERIGDSDLALLTLSNTNNIMPSLAALSLSTNTPVNGTPVIMAGYGRQRVQNAETSDYFSNAVTVADGTGYTTTNTIVKRWGTNAVSGTYVTNTTNTVYTTFNQPSFGKWKTSSEAQATLGDSGGALFSTNGVLLGIAHAVNSSNNTEAPFDRETFYLDVGTYRTGTNGIDAKIGVPLIPEPSTMALAYSAGAGLLVWALIRRRRR